MRTALVTVVALLFAGAALGASTVQGQSRQARTLIVDTSFGLTNADPHFAGQTLPRILNRARYDTLLTFSGPDTSRPQPLLATRWSASPRNKVFRFQLRRDARFADGTPLTAADVVFSFRRAINLRGDASALLPGVTVSAPDPYTFVLNSNVPNPAIPAIVANPLLGIVNAKAAREGGATDAADAATSDRARLWFSSGDSQGTSSGPYTLTAFSTTTEIILGRNLKYWGPRPPYDRIVIRNVPTPTQALNVQRGTHELALDLGANDAAPLKSNKRLKVLETPSAQTFLLFMNNNFPVTSNRRLQQAVRYAINYPAIVALTGPGGVRLPGVIPSNYPGTLPQADAIKRDLARARRELAASGLADETLRLEYPSDRIINGLSFASVAQVVQASLQEAGIKVELVGQPVVTVLTRYLGGRIPFGLVPNLPTIPDPSEATRLLPGGFLGRLAGWDAGEAQAVERLALQARLTPGREARTKVWQDVQRRMNEEGPWIPLVQPTQVIVSTSDVAGVHFNPIWTIDLRLLKPAAASS